ncbi:MAG: Glycosyltransferase AglE [Candidatus Woesearchaeota archaeon]|nr:Glycosyltransferase AglE [Candidatus Woesearchaeota archaeon]
MKVSFIITTYNNQDFIEKCLESVFNQDYDEFDVTLVDDCSSDRTTQIVKKSFPKVKIIVKKKQSGPSKSRNIGIKQTNSDLIVFMDSDVVLKKDWLKKMVSFQKKYNPDIVGGKLLYYSEKNIINSAGGRINWLGFAYDIGRGKPANKHNKIKQVDFLCSAAILVKRDLFSEIGKFDPGYFYGFEDADLCWRANKNGFNVMYNPFAIAYHDVSRTVKNMSDKVYFHGVKNRLDSLNKNSCLLRKVIAIPIHIILTLLSCLLGHCKPKIKGVLYFLNNVNKK